MDNSDPVSSISGLIKLLPKTSIEDYPKILENAQITASELYQSAHFSEEGYVRHCFFRNDDFELLLLCWEAGQKTPVHDHDGQDCWVKIMDGQILETLYKRDVIDGSLKVMSSLMRKSGDLTYMHDDIGLHTLEAAEGRALSLHLYAQPINTCRIYDDQGVFVDEKELEVDSDSMM